MNKEVYPRILKKEVQKKVKQELVKRTIDKLPATFPYIFKAFVEVEDRHKYNRVN